MTPHRYSGWPGAYCIDCGSEDPCEVCMATEEITCTQDDGACKHPDLFKLHECKEPGSNRCNPYDPFIHSPIIVK